MVSSGKWRMKWWTDSAIELTCPGVPVTACASMRPLRSNTPAERSPHSRTIGLNAVRDEHLRLLLDHGDQPVPHDLQVHAEVLARTCSGEPRSTHTCISHVSCIILRGSSASRSTTSG